MKFISVWKDLHSELEAVGREKEGWKREREGSKAYGWCLKDTEGCEN
jgi:hypothetical protein